MGIYTLNFAKQAYQNRSLPASAQRLVNLYCERASDPEDSKSPETLYGTPGLTLFANLGVDAPIYGMHEFNGQVYIVCGDNAYVMSGSGTFTQLSGSMATVTGNVQMMNNGFEVGALKPDGSLYKLTTTQCIPVTDPDLPAVGSITFLDSFLFYNQVNSNLFGSSGVNDITSYDPLDTANAESDSDYIVRVFGDLGELWLFGQETTEIWYNTGDTSGQFPYQKTAGGSVIKRGTAAKLSVVQESNSILFLGDDLVFYQTQGYSPMPISTVAISEALRKYQTVDDAFSFIYTQGGHKFYVTTFPTEQATWVYDLTTGLWHERESFGYTRWRANAFAKAFGKNLVGDFLTGKIYTIDLDKYTEDGTAIRRYGITPHGFDKDLRYLYDYFQIDLESGVGLASGQGSDPMVTLTVSKDGGRQFGNQYRRSIGKVGEYKWRTIWRRLGQARTMCFAFEIAEPVKIAISGAYADITMCDK
jgi:hypothetical protein